MITATPGAGLVEISLGSDQGLLKGHQLEVYRIGGGQSTYVGRIEVVQTDARPVGVQDRSEVPKQQHDGG